MKIKSLFVLGLFLVGILAMSGVASAALNMTLESTKVDDINVETGDIPGLEKANSIDVEVKFTANQDYDDVQVEAQLRGYDHNDLIEDITSAFDVNAGRTYKKTLTLDFKERMDPDVNYLLKVIISTRNDYIIKTYQLDVAATEHSVVITDIELNPSDGVIAGRALLAKVRLQNRGTSAEEDVKVTFSIPELSVSDSDYINELAEDSQPKDSKSTEELYLRIPECAEAGTYEGIAEVRYNDGDDVVRQSVDVEVIADETCGAAEETEPSATGKTIISIGPESQDLAKGAGGVVYPVTVTNAGKGSKTYIISVTGADWGAFRVSPSNVITVGSDETKSAYIYVSANDNAATGMQVFGVAIKAGDKEVKEVTLKANIVAGKTSVSLKRALEIGLIVLVVILVILGLIIGFNKLKGDGEEKEEGQSYY